MKKGVYLLIMARQKTQKQREFDMVLMYNGNTIEFTQNLKITDIDIIRNNKDKINWGTLANRKLTNEIIEEFWDDLKSHMNITDHTFNMKTDILITCKDVIKWYDLITTISPFRFTLDFYKKLEDKIDDYLVAFIYRGMDHVKNIPLETLDYIVLEKNHQNTIKSLSELTTITMSYIDRYNYVLDWELLSFNSNELCNKKNFEKYKDRIDISKFASLHDQFDYNANQSSIVKRINIVLTEEFLLKYKDELDWSQVINWYTFSSLKTLNDKNYKDKINIVSNDFFKKYRDILPKEKIDKGIEEYEKSKDSVFKYVKVDKKYIWDF